MGLCDSVFSDGLEVAVVYFRNGYMPQNYVSEQVLNYFFIPSFSSVSSSRW